MALMETSNDREIFVSHSEFDEPMKVNQKDQLHLELVALIEEGKAPGFKIIVLTRS
jgi:hypothetical protein